MKKIINIFLILIVVLPLYANDNDYQYKLNKALKERFEIVTGKEHYINISLYSVVKYSSIVQTKYFNIKDFYNHYDPVFKEFSNRLCASGSRGTKCVNQAGEIMLTIKKDKNIDNMVKNIEEGFKKSKPHWEIYSSGDLNHFYAYIYDDVIVIVKTFSHHKLDIERNNMFKSIVYKKTGIVL